MQVEVIGEDLFFFENALKTFKKKVGRSGIWKSLDLKSIPKKSERRKQKQILAIRCLREQERKREARERNHRAGKFEWSH